MSKQKTKNVNAKNKKFIKAACTTGIFIVLFFLALVIGSSILTKTNIFGGRIFHGSLFFDLLTRFDALQDNAASGLPVNPIIFANILAELEKTAVGAEAHLSVIKRWRILAKSEGAYINNYYEASNRFAEKFPHAASLQAIAAESQLWVMLAANKDTYASFTTEEAKKIQQTAAKLAENGPLSYAIFSPVVFSLYVLSGALSDVNSAQKIPRIDELFNSIIFENETDERLIIDALLLEILNNDTQRSASALLSHDNLRDAESKQFFANYSYDFADPKIAAKLWSQLGGEENIARAADALFVSNDTNGARKLWHLLAQKGTGVTDMRASLELRSQSLYNLAQTSESQTEKKQFLELVFIENSGGAGNPSAAAEVLGLNDVSFSLLSSIVSWVRLLDKARATEILEESALTAHNAILDLELLRQKLLLIPLDRSIAETWLLLGRHPKNTDLYKWADWHFDFQKQGGQIESLRHFAEQNNIELDIFNSSFALNLMRRKNYTQAYNILFKETSDNAIGYDNWQVHANLGLLLESRREYRAALKEYETAAAMLEKLYNPINVHSANVKAARLYLHIAKMLNVIGRTNEAGPVLEKAAMLDGENINVRRALNELGAGRSK